MRQDHRKLQPIYSHGPPRGGRTRSRR